jgi:hypothetical protein
VSETTKYAVIFRASRSPVPVFQRMKRMLKALLRSYGFAVLECYAVAPDHATGQGETEARNLPRRPDP